MERRRWACPQCGTAFVIPASAPDPSLCPQCMPAKIVNDSWRPVTTEGSQMGSPASGLGDVVNRLLKSLFPIFFVASNDGKPSTVLWTWLALCVALAFVAFVAFMRTGAPIEKPPQAVIPPLSGQLAKPFEGFVDQKPHTPEPAGGDSAKATVARLDGREVVKSLRMTDDDAKQVESHRAYGREVRAFLVPKGIDREQLIGVGFELHRRHPDAMIRIFDDAAELFALRLWDENYPDTSFPYPVQWARTHHLATINNMAVKRDKTRWQMTPGDRYELLKTDVDLE